MRKLFFIFAGVSFALFASASNPFSSPATQAKLKNGSYKPGIILIKMKPEARNACTTSSILVNSLNTKFAQIGVNSISKRFLHAETPSMARNSSENNLIDLSLIYTLTFDGRLNIEEALSLLLSDPNIEYAEPEFINQVFYQPSDPAANATNEYHLTKIQAYSAWDVWKGDTNTVIGIVDSGTDWDHPDLVNNIKYNYADPIDGIDNDGDGFKDNFRGWDVSGNDNNPMVGVSTHGSHVCGDAAASTDNGVGVASPAFKCKFLPVKSTNDGSANSIDNGYDGITYAADHGVNVINLSWGRSGTFSQFEQDIINYAAVNKNVTVVAAAGNNGAEQEFWPATYEHVVSVASTDQSDTKSGFSNYGYGIDVCAPGTQIYSTAFNNTYAAWDGTSMAAPVAAGCAAMVKSKFPSFTAAQVAEQLRVTCDNIYGLSGNSGYGNKLGKGRVNLYKALTDVTSPGVVAKVIKITDGNDDAFVVNDTLQISALFTNLLRPTTNLIVTITAASNQVTVLTPMNSFPVGVLGTLASDSNTAVPFRIRIKPTAPLNLVVPVTIRLTDGTWSDVYSFFVTVNVDYVNIQTNDISTTVNSKGRLGYNLPGQLQGLGFLYKGGANNLYEMGLMIGDGVHQVSDVVRNAGSLNNGTDEDFTSVVRVAAQSNILSDFYATGQFKDSGGVTTTNRLGILISHNAYAWTSSGDRNYVIVEYWVKNTNASITLSNVFAGLFADWDIPAYANNKGREDAARKMGYVYSTDNGGLYCGMKLLTTTAPFNHYSIDNTAGGFGGINLYNGGFDETEKYKALTTHRANAGDSTATGNDIIDVVSSGPFTIAPNNSFKVAFALIAGENLAELQAGADAAQIKYDAALGLESITDAKSPFTAYPNPTNKEITFRFSLAHPSALTLSVFNALGENVKELINEKLGAGSYSYYSDMSDLPIGTYFVQLRTADKTETQKILIVR